MTIYFSTDLHISYPFLLTNRDYMLHIICDVLIMCECLTKCKLNVLKG